MPFQTGQIYNLNANTFIFGPLNISGFGDDGAVEYTFLSEDDFEIIVGYDGATVANAIQNYAGIAEIKVKETSRTYRELGALLQIQRLAARNGQPIPRYNWRHSDSINGDGLNDGGCLIVGGPGLTKTNRFSVRPFKILLPNAKSLITYGANNA